MQPVHVHFLDLCLHLEVGKICGGVEACLLGFEHFAAAFVGKASDFVFGAFEVEAEQGGAYIHGVTLLAVDFDYAR